PVLGRDGQGHRRPRARRAPGRVRGRRLLRPAPGPLQMPYRGQLRHVAAPRSDGQTAAPGAPLAGVPAARRRTASGAAKPPAACPVRFVMADGRLRRIPEATVARLPVYWRALLELGEARTPTVSSEGLAEMAGENAAKVGQHMEGLVVSPVDDLPALVEREGLAIGLIATPAAAAQMVADRLVAAGVTSLLNFAPTVLTTPDHVLLRQVDLSIELQILS